MTTKLNDLSVSDWCQDADDWDDDNNANINEENGNVINISQIGQPSDDDDSCSFEEQIRVGIGHLTFDDKNANTGADVEGKQKLFQKQIY